jgi:hypothetical protein
MLRRRAVRKTTSAAEDSLMLVGAGMAAALLPHTSRAETRAQSSKSYGPWEKESAHEQLYQSQPGKLHAR